MWVIITSLRNWSNKSRIGIDSWQVWDRVGIFVCLKSRLGLQHAAELGLVQGKDFKVSVPPPPTLT